MKQWEANENSALESSLPLRKCGLKHMACESNFFRGFVTSLAEVWIETLYKVNCNTSGNVTSLAEVWIETGEWLSYENGHEVTSLAEVWIETSALLR